MFDAGAALRCKYCGKEIRWDAGDDSLWTAGWRHAGSALRHCAYATTLAAPRREVP